MTRRLIDISVALKTGIKSDPPHMLPEIEYIDHKMSAPAMAEYMGVKVEDLPEGEYAAVERGSRLLIPFPHKAQPRGHPFRRHAAAEAMT